MTIKFMASIALALASLAANADTTETQTLLMSEQLIVPYGGVVTSPVWQLSKISNSIRIKISIDNGNGGYCGGYVIGVNVATLANSNLGPLKNLGQGYFESNIGKKLQVTHIQVVLNQTSYSSGLCRVSATAVNYSPELPYGTNEIQNVCGTYYVSLSNFPQYWLMSNGRKILLDRAPNTPQVVGSQICLPGKLSGDFLELLDIAVPL